MAVDLPGGPHRRIGSPGGHTVGFDPRGAHHGITSDTFHLNNPAGRSTSEDWISGGRHTKGSNPRGRGGTPGAGFEFEYLGEFEFIFERLQGMIRRLWERFLGKRLLAVNLVSVFLYPKRN